MRSRKKYFPLSQKGINDAIAYLESYKKQLILKTQKLLEELAKIGIREADTSHAVITSVTSDGTNVRMNIKITGEDLVFIEFGAGVHFNGHAGEGVHESDKYRLKFPEYRIGKYGTNEEWQWSLGVNDSWHVNGETVYGTKATMPVYGAWLAMSDVVKINKAAQKVFSNWS